MTTRTKGRKRRRSQDNDDALNNKNKKRQKTEAQQLMELSEYFCCICKELSVGKIFQCSSGCLMCDGCYPLISMPMRCPLCRVPMSKTKPIRCRIAERALALRTVSCRHDGCNKEVTFGNLLQHENECEYMPMDCKYKILGCQWKGLKQNLEEHESKCECDQNQSLQIVQQISDKLKMYQKFCSLSTNLSSSNIEPMRSENNEFDETTDEFFYEGYEYIVRLKSEKKRVRRSNVYTIKAKIEFAEDIEQIATSDSDQVSVGIIIDQRGICNLIKELSFTLTPTTIQSQWFSFDNELTNEQYTQLYRGGFAVKIFCFGEDI